MGGRSPKGGSAGGPGKESGAAPPSEPRGGGFPLSFMGLLGNRRRGDPSCHSSVFSSRVSPPCPLPPRAGTCPAFSQPLLPPPWTQPRGPARCPGHMSPAHPPPRQLRGGNSTATMIREDWLLRPATLAGHVVHGKPRLPDRRGSGSHHGAVQGSRRPQGLRGPLGQKLLLRR